MLIGSINNKGSLQGRINSATYLTGVISTAGLLGGKIVAERGLKGDKGDTGDTGATGNGIASVTFVSSSGLVDTYKITFTNGTETTFDVTNGQDGIDGQDGADGFSPIANVAKVGDTATITVTDEDGTTTATITDGQDGIDGQDGVDGHSPSVTASKAGKVTTVYVDGSSVATINDGNDGQDGTDGQDGHSPVVTASKVGKVTTVSVDGSAIATINDGNDGQDGQDGTDGQDGFSPSANVSKVGSVATITITDKDGTTTASVSDGSGVPSGGTAGQILTKHSATDYDVEWADSDAPTKTSDLINDSGFITGMTILSYGNSTWQNFIDAYNADKVVYCRASSNANPATGSQTRLAFMAYVNNATTPTEVEFQYYRSVSSHSASQQGDQVFVYKLNKTNGWSVTTREASSKVVAGTGMSSSYSSGVLTLTASGEANVQSDWSQSDTTADDYIKNKPTIPTVNDATLTIQKNGTTVNTFTANASTDVTADISVPTNTSDLNNDSGFITSSNLIDMFYPVGSYYETSDSTFDPNVAWGGTWSLETEGQVHVSAGENYDIGDTGGSETHSHTTGNFTLQATHIPAHTHGSKTLTGTFQFRRYGTTANAGNIVSGYSGIVTHSTPTGQDNLANIAVATGTASTAHERLTITATHEHTSVGGGNAHNHGDTGSSSTMQPYIVVNRWHRTA